MGRRCVAVVLLLVACSRAAQGHQPGAFEPNEPNEDEGEVAVEVESAGPTQASVTPPPVEDVVVPVAHAEAVREVVRVPAWTMVHARPDAASVQLGRLAVGTRVEVRRRVNGPGCEQSWLAIEPRGFVCADAEPTQQPPSEAILPQVPAGARVPGTYGRIRVDEATLYPTLSDAKARRNGRTSLRALTVRRTRTVRDGDRTLWKTPHGWVDATHVRRFRGSRFEGVALVGDAPPQLPVGWTLSSGKRRTVALRTAPSEASPQVRRLRPRTLVEITAETADGAWARIGDEGWIAVADLKIARAREVPDVVGPAERWLDIDLDDQVLVAYEGATPTYATLVSTGRVLHRTPTGVFRITRKVAERTMKSMADSDDLYTVDKVPWTAYFATGYALHAAFWHDGFGTPRSHGCINLAPIDARRLYGWMAPAVAAGWVEVFGHEEQPGSLVRIRSRRDPQPEQRG